MTAGILKVRWEEFLWGTAPRGRLGESARLAARVFWKFFRDRAPVRASALAFVSALNLIPLLTLIFAIVKALGAQGKIASLYLEHLAPGNAEIVARILAYVDRVDAKALGATGFVSFFIFAFLVLSNVEQVMNDIWGVGRGRTLVRKITDYTAILMAGPALLLLATSLTTTWQVSRHLESLRGLGAAGPLLLSFLPFVAKCFAFSASYLILPNHRVSLGAAAVGGVAAGILWNGAEWIYIRFQISATQYNAVYGALAQLPAFLVWVYVGWCIVLAGAELACLMDLPGRGRFIKGGEELWMPRFGATLAILSEVARRFAAGSAPADDETLVEGAGIHPVEGRRVVEALVAAGLLAYTDANPPRLVPAVSPDRTSMGEVVRRVAQPLEGESGEEKRFLGEIERRLSDRSWAAWVEEGDARAGRGAQR